MSGFVISVASTIAASAVIGLVTLVFGPPLRRAWSNAAHVRDDLTVASLAAGAAAAAVALALGIGRVLYALATWIANWLNDYQSAAVAAGENPLPHPIVTVTSTVDSWRWHWFAAATALMMVYSASQIAMAAVPAVSRAARVVAPFVVTAIGLASVAAAVGLHAGADAILARAEDSGPGGSALPMPAGLESRILPWPPHWTALVTALTVSTFLVYRSLRLNAHDTVNL